MTTTYHLRHLPEQDAVVLALRRGKRSWIVIDIDALADEVAEAVATLTATGWWQLTAR